MKRNLSAVATVSVIAGTSKDGRLAKSATDSSAVATSTTFDRGLRHTTSQAQGVSTFLAKDLRLGDVAGSDDVVAIRTAIDSAWSESTEVQSVAAGVALDEGVGGTSSELDEGGTIRGCVVETAATNGRIVDSTCKGDGVEPRSPETQLLEAVPVTVALSLPLPPRTEVPPIATLARLMVSLPPLP